MKKKILTLFLALTFASNSVIFVNAQEDVSDIKIVEETPTETVTNEEKTEAVTEEKVEIPAQENTETKTEETPVEQKTETPVVEEIKTEQEPVVTEEKTEEVEKTEKETEETPVKTEEDTITISPNDLLPETEVETAKPEETKPEETKVEEAETVEPVTEEVVEKEIENFVGRSEDEIPEETLNSENTIIKYIITEDAQPGQILNQSIDGDVLTLEIASQPLITESKANVNLLNSFDLFSQMTEAPSVEDNSWDNYPVSYEYNWDNSQSAWQWGEWRDGVKYTTEQGTYDNNVRHAMGMYSDGENIHLHISYATIYQSIANGDDFNFYIDGQGAKVRVLYADNGSGITGQAREEGKYDLVVVNGDHWNSGYEANGSYGTMIVKEGNINNELEIVVPLSTLKEQNSNINTDNIQNIEFFTPNLMYRRISCGGASSGPQGFILISGIVFMVPLVFRKKFEEVVIKK